MNKVKSWFDAWKERRNAKIKEELELKAKGVIRIDERAGRIVILVNNVVVFKVKNDYDTEETLRGHSEYIAQEEAFWQLSRLRLEYVEYHCKHREIN